MHLGDPAVGMLPAIAIVAGGNSVVSGLGLAMKLSGDDRVAVCFFGEGATNEGAFHEGLNFAAVQRLPIVFACENNLYGASTSFSAVSLVEDVAARASAYGVPARIVDGMDVLAVREATSAGGRGGTRRRRADAARVQDLPLHRPQPQRRARIPQLRGGARMGGPRPADRARARAERARARPARGGGQGGARRRGRVRAQLAVPRARRRLQRRLCLSSPARHAAAHDRRSAPRGDRRRDARRRARLPDRRGHRRRGRVRRRLRRLSRPGRGVRARADHRHADQREGDRGRRRRRRRARDAADRRHAVLRLPLRVHGRARQPGGEAALHVGRQGLGAARDARPRRREPPRRSARSVPRELLHPRPGAEGGRPLGRLPRQGDPEERDSRREPGARLRAQAALRQQGPRGRRRTRPDGRGSRRATTPSRSAAR